MASSVTDLNYTYVQCRALLHAWDELPYDGAAPTRWRNSTRSTAILLFRCIRCGTKRYDVWSRVTGDLIERAYRTPEGYSLPKGKGRKVLVRKEYLRRSNGGTKSAKAKANLRRVS
jgi:hypothetical protein